MAARWRCAKNTGRDRTSIRIHAEALDKRNAQGNVCVNTLLVLGKLLPQLDGTLRVHIVEQQGGREVERSCAHVAACAGRGSQPWSWDQASCTRRPMHANAHTLHAVHILRRRL